MKVANQPCSFSAVGWFSTPKARARGGAEEVRDWEEVSVVMGALEEEGEGATGARYGLAVLAGGFDWEDEGKG
jgi:hypothetical protein